MIGVEALKIIRAKHLEAIGAQLIEAKPKVIVHVLVYNTVLCHLTKYLQNMIEDIGVRPPVYLHSIFEISSVTRIFFNFKISSLKN